MANAGPDTAAKGRRESFLAPFVASGYTAVEPAILQPAAVFLDISGEDLARRLYLTTDADGRELCLRPELTIPVCLDHLAQGVRDRPARYAYYGRAFRHRPGESGEFWQAGVESIGDRDHAAADAEVFALALACARRHGIPAPRVRAGDTGLFRRALAALALPSAWQRRLARAFGRQNLAGAALEPIIRGGGSVTMHAGVLAALSGTDRAGARALVEDLLRIGGHETVGGRSVSEIADRFLEQADLTDGGRDGLAALGVLADLLAVEGALPDVPERIAAVAARHGIDLDAPIASLEARTRALAAAGVDPAAITFAAGFGRRLDYYSGFVFEMHDPAAPERHQVVGGGRYDDLLRLLGAPEDLPGVGFSVWIERLPGGRP